MNSNLKIILLVVVGLVIYYSFVQKLVKKTVSSFEEDLDDEDFED